MINEEAKIVLSKAADDLPFSVDNINYRCYTFIHLASGGMNERRFY